MTETPRQRWVVDTNVLVSRVLRPQSTPAHAVRLAIDLGVLLFSTDTHAELRRVIRRAKFNAYAPLAHRIAFLSSLDEISDWVTPDRPIRACRDPRDDKFLEVAVHGDADAVITGDEDLLALHPFHGVPILTPQDFLALHAPAPLRPVSARKSSRRKAGIVQFLNERRAAARTRTDIDAQVAQERAAWDK